MRTSSIIAYVSIAIVLLATSSCVRMVNRPVISIGEHGDTSWGEALQSGVIQPVEAGTKLSEAAELYYMERIEASEEESEFGLVSVKLIPDVTEVADESGKAYSSLVMVFPDMRDRDPSFLGVGAWDYLNGRENDLSGMVIHFSILAPRGIRDLSLEVIDANGNSRGWFMSNPKSNWAEYVIDPSKTGPQGLFRIYKGSSSFDITHVVTIRLGETVRGRTFFREPVPTTGSRLSWNAWNDLRILPASRVIKPRLACLDPLREYLVNGTNCVYRRNPKDYFNIEMPMLTDATAYKLKITDPKKPDGVTKVRVKGPVVSGGKALFRLEIPKNNPVGIYRIKGEASIGSRHIESAELSVYIIFDVPPSLQADKSAVKAYLYDEAGHRDSGSYQFSGRSGSTWKNSSVYGKTWPEKGYVLNPFDKNLFAMAIQAVNGEKVESSVAKNLMWGVSNVIFYTVPNGNNHVPKMLGSLTKDRFVGAYGPSGKEIQNVRGQCLDYANSLAALLRSVGIPSRVATKIAAQDFSYHQWTEAFLESPPAGSDKWYIYDAMDYTPEPHTDVQNDLASNPTGAEKRLSAPYGYSAFEILVGGTDWQTNGKVEIKETKPAPNRRIGVRRVSNAKDALFEKCEQKHYNSANCPDIDPPEPRLVVVNLDRRSYRVGDTVTTTVEITNPLRTSQPFELSFRILLIDAADDGRDAFGDPVFDVKGSGVLGETRFHTKETVEVPENSRAVRRFSFKIPEINLPTDQYWVEIRVSGEAGKELHRTDIPVATGYDTEIHLEPGDPMLGKDVVVHLSITNRMSDILTNLTVDAEVPGFLSMFDEPTHTIHELSPGENVDLAWRLAPVTREIPNLQHLRFLIRSDNGGNLAEPFRLILKRPGIPRIRPIIVPSTVAAGQIFKVSYEVENVGDTVLRKAKVSLLVPEESAFMEESLTQTIGDLLPGESAGVTWTVEARAAGWILLSVKTEDEEGVHFETRKDLIEILEAE